MCWDTYSIAGYDSLLIGTLSTLARLIDIWTNTIQTLERASSKGRARHKDCRKIAIVWNHFPVPRVKLKRIETLHEAKQMTLLCSIQVLFFVGEIFLKSLEVVHICP